MRDPQDREVELSFWQSVRESDNPATLQAYLEKYPEGEFSPLLRFAYANSVRRPRRLSRASFQT
jgi:adenylate cyclase